MKRTVVLWAATGTVALSAFAQALPTAGEGVSAPASPAASVDVGRRTYTSICARCHGINLVVTSSAYFDLRTFPKDEKLRFLDSVTNGKRQMPAWGGTVKPEAIESIWLYIGSVNGW